jgi:flavodoxin I
MSKIGLFFGTQTGKTEGIAEMIRDEFGASEIDLHDMSQVSVSDFDGYTKLIIASPTWDIGELQSDWDGFFPELDTTQQSNIGGEFTTIFLDIRYCNLYD